METVARFVAGPRFNVMVTVWIASSLTNLPSSLPSSNEVRKLTEPSPPSHFKVVGTPPVTDVGTCVNPIFDCARAATTSEAPTKKLLTSCILKWKIDSGIELVINADELNR